MFRSNSRVLVGFGESLSGPEVVWSLLENGYSVDVFSRKGISAPIAADKRVRVWSVCAPEIDVSQSLHELQQLVQRSDWAAVLAIDDAALYLTQQLQDSISTVLASAAGDAGAVALDKGLQLRVAETAGFAVPKSVVIKKADDQVIITDFPLILKPLLAAHVENGRLCRGRVWRCTNQGELDKALSIWNGRWPAVIQPVLIGEGRGLFGLSDGSDVLFASAHVRVRMMNPIGSGASACRADQVSESQRECMRRFIQECSWRGMFMIELLRTADCTDWFMELNGRAWGSMALARRCGFEYPAWTVQQALACSLTPRKQNSIGEGTCRHIGREIVHVLHVLRGISRDSGVDVPGRWRTLRDVCAVHSTDRWYNNSVRSVMLRDAWRSIRSVL